MRRIFFAVQKCSQHIHVQRFSHSAGTRKQQDFAGILQNMRYKRSFINI
jgi:hypothetical protein